MIIEVLEYNDNSGRFSPEPAESLLFEPVVKVYKASTNWAGMHFEREERADANKSLDTFKGKFERQMHQLKRILKEWDTDKQDQPSQALVRTDLTNDESED